MSKDGTRIGSLKQVVELRARIAELESKLAAEREARGIDTNRLLCALAAERERREAAEAELAAKREQRASSAPEDIARRFHDAYEYLAPQFGYSTRPESRVAWDELPQNLRDLMIAVVRSVLIEQPFAERKRREAAEAELAAKRGRREDIRANERRALREKLICAALTGMLSNPNVYGAPEHFAGLVIKQADAVLTALDKEAAE